MTQITYAAVLELGRQLPRHDQATLISDLAAMLAGSSSQQTALPLKQPAQRAAALAELQAAFATSAVRGADQLEADRAERQATLEGSTRADH